MHMNGTERIRAMIDMQPFDRVGVSGWVHLPMVDHHVQDMVRATIFITEYCGWDFVKIMSTGHYMTEAYGGDITPSVDPCSWQGNINRFPVLCENDLQNLTVLTRENPVFNREMKIARSIKRHYKERKPVISTIFNPLTSLQELMSRGKSDKLMDMILFCPGAVKHALKKITETIKNYVDFLIEEAHIDGIFLANQYMSSKIITERQFEEFCLPYDMELMSHIKERTWFNILHVHGESSLMFREALKYDVQAYSWENCAPGIPEEEIASVRFVRAHTDKVLVTGLARHYDYYESGNDRAKIKRLFLKRLQTVMDESQDRRIIFAPGCALPLDVDKYVFTIMHECVDEAGRPR